MPRFIALLATLAVGAVAVSPVTTLNATKYFGRWYQMYANSIEILTNENHSLCETADYGQYPNNTISVLNRARLHTADGPELIFPGWATIPNPQKPGELVVHLVGVPVAAPYWVFKLGPETYGPDGLYEYAVVSSELQISLFVLSRNVTAFYTKWKPEVDTFLATNGWNKIWNKPIPIIQDGCVYW